MTSCCTLDGPKTLQQSRGGSRGGGGGGGGFGGCNPLSYMVTPPLLLNSPSPFPAFCIGPEALDSTPPPPPTLFVSGLNGQHPPPPPPPPLFVSGLKRTAPPPPAFCIGPEAGSTPPAFRSGQHPPAFRIACLNPPFWKTLYPPLQRVR